MRAHLKQTFHLRPAPQSDGAFIIHHSAVRLPSGDGWTEGERLCYPSARQGPRLRWQFPPVYPGGQMQRYPPSPVSMQVALAAQGLDEHWRASERRGGKLMQSGEKKRKEKLFLDLVFHPSFLPPFLHPPHLPPPPLPPSLFQLSRASCSHHKCLVTGEQN